MRTSAPTPNVATGDRKEATMASIVALPRLRGEGSTYVGSLLAFVGWVVVSMDDCSCHECVELEPWDPRRRCDVIVTDGGERVRLEHARQESFRRP
jgi:hypothetical protein